MCEYVGVWGVYVGVCLGTCVFIFVCQDVCFFMSLCLGLLHMCGLSQDGCSERSCDPSVEGLGDAGGEQDGAQLCRPHWPHKRAQVFDSVPREPMEGCA